MIEKMKFLSITGPKEDIDRVADVYLSRYEIQLENALSELKTVKDLRPYIEINPYKGELDRAKLGQAVFGSAEKLNALNAIVHPEVKQWVRSDIERKKETQVPLYVIEAALLLEAGYQDICDELWYIFVPQDIRRERLKASRGYSDERIDKMFASQLTDEAFKAGCTVVIDNGGTFENTIRQIGDRL